MGNVAGMPDTKTGSR